MLQGAGLPISPILFKRAKLKLLLSKAILQNEILKELTCPKFNQKLELSFEKMNLLA